MIGMDILQPVVALLAWTMVMWVWMYATRIPAMNAAKAGRKVLVMHDFKQGGVANPFVQRALAELDAEDRNALRAFYSQGLTVDQLGTMLGIHRATLRKKLKQYDLL